MIERDESGEMTLLDAGSNKPIVTYPDELLEQAVDKMVRHDIGRLPVVQRSDPKQLVCYLGRTGIAAGLRQIFEEERVREEGWLTGRKSRRPA